MGHYDNEFGRRVASLRKEKGYTQEKISAMLNVTPQAISKWEQGSLARYFAAAVAGETAQCIH
ncbi:helix-turn-helix domain-containing protein [Acetonema longum]|uniref:HTH cro/C1-type domain-containing protein n=1 Tax=Acetonema longum DSM 6540 TaxID=1009370 RepID=F7NE00_9FIRM|nr:helix-turn-helix transcriptional regulator [Acetonema longum]EGO65754.1 hypothetical protein ALO_01310 [Acetonema longum DSM 6540]